MKQQVIYRKLTELTKYPGNPRTIKASDFDKLCKSLNDNPEYFEARPLILSNRTGKFIILAGNQRFEAAKKLKLKEVPTFLIEGLTEEKEKEIVIRDNVSNGEWDMEILANEWDTESLNDWGMDLPLDKPEGHKEFEENTMVKTKFEIICDTLKQIEELQNIFKINETKISFAEFIIKTGL